MRELLKKKANHESKLQRHCVRWFKFQYPKETLYAIPNGGKRSPIEAKIMSGEGVMSGVLDLFLMKARNDYNGLYIEMKYGKNKLTQNQKEFIKKAEAQGYKTAVCYTFDEFMSVVNEYLK
jgi:hypothetical protein